MANRGWIKLSRKLLESPIWDSGKEFDERSAWIDLLLMAAHKDTRWCKRGQIVTSIGELEKRWKWGRHRVYRFLRNNDVKINGTSRGTTLTIENYAKYQGERTASGTPNSTPNDTPNSTPNDTQTRISINRNNNYINNNKNIENKEECKNDKEGDCADSVDSSVDFIDSMVKESAKERLRAYRKHVAEVNAKWSEKEKAE